MTSNNPNQSDSTEAFVDRDDKAIAQAQPEVKQDNKAIAKAQPKEKRQIISRADITDFVLTSIRNGFVGGLCGLAVKSITHRTITQHNAFEKDQRAIESTLQLATYWETNLDADTRRRLRRIIAKDNPQQKLLKFLANDGNVNNPELLKSDKRVLELLELGSNAKSSTITTEASLYGIAIIRVLNTLETVASVRTNIKSDVAKTIFDDEYRCNIQQRYEQLKPFIDEYRKNNNSNSWKPLDYIFEDTEGAWNKNKKLRSCQDSIYR